MNDSKKYFHPELISRIPRFYPRSQVVVEGFLAGGHRSRLIGQSSEFMRHREYVAGDDTRYIDWKVWARQDRFYVRQQQQETNRSFCVLMDHSGSMGYGGNYWTKYDCGATLAVSLVWLATLRLDAAGCIMFNRGMTEATPYRTGRDAAFLTAQRLEERVPVRGGEDTGEETTDLADSFRYVGANLSRGGLVAIISDLFVDTRSLYNGLEQLRRQGHETVVFHILDDDELDFPFEERSRFEDLESNRVVHCDPRTVRACYRELIEQKVKEIQQNCLRCRSQYCLLRTSQPLDAALAVFFAKNGKGGG